MKTPIARLTGRTLLSAIIQVLPIAKQRLEISLKPMGYSELMDFIKRRPRLHNAFERLRTETENPTLMVLPVTLRDLILRVFPDLPGDNDMVEACEDDLWPLCEELLEWYCLSLEGPNCSQRGLLGWVASDDTLVVLSASPREAILRWVVRQNIGSDFIHLVEANG